MRENKMPSENLEACLAHLMQGDIFDQSLIGAISASNFKILKKMGNDQSIDVGSVGQYKVFSSSDVFSSLKGEEFIFTELKKTKGFIISSQSCDISGVDKSPTPYCMVTPVSTVSDICMYQQFPLDDSTITVNGFIKEHLWAGGDPNDFDLLMVDEGRYFSVITELLNNKLAVKKYDSIRKRLKNMLNKAFSGGEQIFCIPGDKELGLHPSIAYLDQVFIVKTGEVEAAKCRRVASLKSPFKEKFSRQQGDRIARIATAVVEKPTI
jgi:hypothetical protein